MSNDRSKERLNVFKEGNQALVPASRTFTDDERKLISFSIATQAAVLQFIMEGIIPEHEQQHFVVHLQDFMARLYAGETVDLKMEQQFKVDSKTGELFLEATEEALRIGKVDRSIISQRTGQDNQSLETFTNTPTPIDPKKLN